MTEIQNIRLNKVEVKLADTDDPVALKISWDPARSGGANFKTQKIKFDQDKIMIVKTVGAILFGVAFLIPGLCVLFIGGPLLLSNEGLIPAAIATVFGLVFSYVGLSSLRNYREMTFDRSSGFYYRGKAYDSMTELDRNKQGHLTDIYALQLISERIQSTSSKGRSHNYTSYELNLVFSDCERINVMDHGRGMDVEASAKALAEFLHVPIWKAVY
jgi:hypothetical protein